MIHKWRMHTKILLLCLGVASSALLFQTFWFQKTSSGMIYQETKDESFHMLQNMQDDIYNLVKRMETILIKVYNERDFIQDLKNGTGIEYLKEVYYREAYTIATTNFETSDNVVALYLYNADHEIISTYRRAVTPRHNYPLDIYTQEAVYNAGIVKEYIKSEETAMLISSYYNTSREREIIRFVLKLYDNGNFKHKIGYVVCDTDSRGLLSIMEKYSTGEDSYLWLQPQGDRAALYVGNLEKTETGKLENFQKSIQNGIIDDNEMIESSDRVFFQVEQSKYNFGAYSLMPQEIFYENQKILFRNMVFIVVTMLGATLVITFFVTKTLTKPLEKMADTAQEIKEGNTKLRMEELGEDEIGQLGRNFNEMLDTVEELIARDYRAKLLLNQAEYNALQAQINPHFLYNTLDTMGSIADMQGCGQVSVLCQSLSNMFRYSMDIRHPFSTVAKELVHLKNYIYMMDVRMQDHIQYEFNIEEAVLDDSIPRLSIQPIVENALNHGLRNSKGRKEVQICAGEYQGNLRIMVKDNGAGMPQKLIEDLLNPEYAAEKEEGKSVGIYNINMRMKLLYGKDYGLSISSEPGQGTCVTLLAARKGEENG